MRKVFKALGSEVVDKRFVGDDDATPDGWHSTTADAMAAWVEPKKARKPKKDSVVEDTHDWDMANARCLKCGANLEHIDDPVCAGESTPESDAAKRAG